MELKHTIKDPLRLRWDKTTSQYKVSKPEIDEEELVSKSVAEELLEALQDIYNCQYDTTKTLSNLNGLISDSINIINKATK